MMNKLKTYRVKTLCVVALALTLLGCVQTSGQQTSKKQVEVVQTVPKISPSNVLSAGPFGACVIDQNLKAQCWGKNYMQKNNHYDCRVHEDKWGEQVQVAIKGESLPYTCYGRAYAPNNLGKVLAVAETHTGVCAILADATGRKSNVRCWGPEMNTDTPEFIDFVQLSGGDRHACGIRANGNVLCWPTTATSQKTNYNKKWAGQYPKPPSGIKAQTIASTGDAVCAITTTDNQVVCWGGLTAPSGLRAKQVSTGGGWPDYAKKGKPKFPAQACAIDMSDKVVCWGAGDALNVPDGLTAKSIATNSLGSCAVTLEGKGVCWGQDINLNPELYQDTQPQGQDLKQVSAAKGVVIFLREDSSLYNYRGYKSNDKPYFIPPPEVRVFN